MRASRLVCLGLLIGLTVATYSNADGAGYSRFSSRTCGYSVDYPTGWKVAHSSGADSFSVRKSATSYAAVAVLCTKRSTGMSTRSFTAAELRSYQKSGWTVSKVSYASGFGIFTARMTLHAGKAGYLAEIELTSGVHNNKGWAYLYSADAGSFGRYLPVYVHMLRSVSTR